MYVQYWVRNDLLLRPPVVLVKTCIKSYVAREHFNVAFFDLLEVQ